MTGEAQIVINGRVLTEAQSMTLRVAVADMLMRMSDPNALGPDEHGRAMTKAYMTRAREIEQLMFMPRPPEF